MTQLTPSPLFCTSPQFDRPINLRLRWINPWHKNAKAHLELNLRDPSLRFVYVSYLLMIKNDILTLFQSKKPKCKKRKSKFESSDSEEFEADDSEDENEESEDDEDSDDDVPIANLKKK